MFTQLLGTAATAYGVLAALTALLQTRQMLARRTSCEVSARFLASYAGGYAIWLTYGLSTGSIPLIVVDTAGLLCGGLTLAVALSLRGSLIRPATWNNCNTTSISPRPTAPDPQVDQVDDDADLRVPEGGFGRWRATKFRIFRNMNRICAVGISRRSPCSRRGRLPPSVGCQLRWLQVALGMWRRQ
jgi:uncharacterized protein with PQ loop repeat